MWKGDVMDIPTVHAQHLSSASLVVAVKDWDRCSCGKVNIKTCPTHPQCTCHDLIGEAVLPLNDLLKRKRSAIKKTVRLTRPGHAPMGECEFVVYCQESVNTELELWKKEVQRRGGGALNQRARPSTLALPGSEPPSQSNTSARKAPKGLATVGEGGGGGEDVAQLKAELTELKFAFFNHAVGESYLGYRYQVYIYSIVLV